MSSIVNKAKEVLHKNESELQFAGQKVHGIGYGLMGLTWRASPPSQEQSFEAMKTALDSGANLWNAGELYGTPERNSLHLLNEYFTKYPEDAKKVVISIKGGLVPGAMKPDGSEKNTRRSIEECLRVLDGKKKLDLWEAARVDPETPIEITIRTANEYVKAGKLGGISLSECSADSIRRAAKVAKIDAVEVEFSLWATEILDNGVAQACAELDIPIVAYSPLGRGFLTGQIKSPDDIPEGDFRKHLPRFQPENFDQNLKLVTEVESLAKRKGVKPGQLAIAWVRAQSNKAGMPKFVPIPGASSSERVKENLVEVELSDADVKEIDSLIAGATVAGGRYGEHAGGHLEYGDSPELKE
ncbi:Putative NADP-dependent oxidoreductase domain-containing protein [Septoria linicola]|uniref:NADP-dependent oxidoreductase domain-containing protein n=1 Tax=Septoria linicola TaxID=215465 RepID=A0A9Q9EEF9_9PEZI|nr:putative NADP-dependent oxidoreductase domain-containing protein [Septoria linicola]USW46874.1 Putative NADP-dependent oxidoreductase domain-containing protein [Septoria linicola]